MTMIPPALYESFGRRAHAHLDTEAIGSMFSAPSVVIPAPGPGKVIVVTGGFAHYVRIAGQWNVVETRILYAGNGPYTSNIGTSAACVFTPILDGSGGDDPQAMTIVSAGDDGTEPMPLANCVDRAIVVASRDADPTDGEGDLYLTLFYTVLDLD